MLLGPLNQKIVNDALHILTNDPFYYLSNSTCYSRSNSTRPNRCTPNLISSPNDLGALMRQSQQHFNALARPQCPSELTAPHLQRLLAYEKIQPLIWGGKGIGSQGDGSAQLVCRGAAEQEQVQAILEKDLGVECMPLNLGVHHADDKPFIHDRDLVSI